MGTFPPNMPKSEIRFDVRFVVAENGRFASMDRDYFWNFLAVSEEINCMYDL